MSLQAHRLAMLPWRASLNLIGAGFGDVLLKPEDVLSVVELGNLLN